MCPSLRYKRQKLFLKQFLQKHSLKLRCPGVWDRLEKVSSADFTSQSGTSQASRSLGLPPATKGELCFSSETSNRWLSRITAESHTATSHSNHSRLIAPSQPQEPLRKPIHLLQARTAEAQHCSRTTATSQPHCTRNKAEPQPHRSRITTESQPHDRHTRAESTSFEL